MCCSEVVPGLESPGRSSRHVWQRGWERRHRRWLVGYLAKPPLHAAGPGFLPYDGLGVWDFSCGHWLLRRQGFPERKSSKLPVS